MYRSIPAAMVAATLILSGCDSDPTGSDGFPNVRGTYNAEQTVTLTAPGLGVFTFECDGVLTIDQQTEGAFSGTLVTEASDGCGGESITSEFSGTVDEDGDVALGEGVVDSTGDLADDSGCTITSIVGPTGSFSGGVITASANVLGNCDIQGNLVDIEIDLEFLARRT